MLWKVPGALLYRLIMISIYVSKSNKEVTDYYSTLLSTINFLARLQPSGVKTPFREAVTEEYCSVTVVWLIF